VTSSAAMRLIENCLIDLLVMNGCAITAVRHVADTVDSLVRAAGGYCVPSIL
jgi:hypothetical protein